MQWLNINQDTLSNISYYCIGTKFELINVGIYSGGALISFQMDSTGAWSNQATKLYSTSGGTLNFKLLINTDYDDEIVHPIVTISATSNGNISIQNVTRNETITITGCVNGEVVILDGISGKIKTTASGVLLDRWNKKFLRLQDLTNNIILTGNFNLKLQYRQQIRVGG
jgi:hypothetical protein